MYGVLELYVISIVLLCLYVKVMWETFTLAKSPYVGIGNSEVLDKINEGYRLTIPENCPEPIADMMRRCWSKDPISRPSFKDIYAVLDALYEGPRESTIEFGPPITASNSTEYQYSKVGYSAIEDSQLFKNNNKV